MKRLTNDTMARDSLVLRANESTDIECELEVNSELRKGVELTIWKDASYRVYFTGLARETKKSPWRLYTEQL